MAFISGCNLKIWSRKVEFVGLARLCWQVAARFNSVTNVCGAQCSFCGELNGDEVECVPVMKGQWDSVILRFGESVPVKTFECILNCGFKTILLQGVKEYLHNNFYSNVLKSSCTTHLILKMIFRIVGDMVLSMYRSNRKLLVEIVTDIASRGTVISFIKEC